MKKLICTNPKNYRLTLNKEYLIVVDEEETVMIVNDNNKTVRYYKDLFQEVEEEIEVVPEPEPIPARTEQDLIDSITVDGRDLNYVNFNNETVVISSMLSIIGNSNEFSCGIKNVVNITTQFNEIYNKIENDQDLIGDDLNDLKNTLFKKIMFNFLNRKLGEGYNAAMYLFSTNVTNTELTEEDLDLLDEISDFKSEIRENPNNGNDIVLWGIYKSSL